MDPDVTLQEMMQAVVDGDYDTALDAAIVLNKWLATDGFEPDWKAACFALFENMPEGN